MTEQEAITRLKAGEIDALAVLVRAYQSKALRVAFSITHEQALAEDSVQEAFMRTYQYIDSFDGQRPFGPWLMRIVVNEALKRATRERSALPLADDERQPPEPAPNGGFSHPESQVVQRERAAAVHAALSQLSPEQRAAVVMRYYLDMREAEIAAALNCPPGTVKSRLHTARSRLRPLLRAIHPTPKA